MLKLPDRKRCCIVCRGLYARGDMVCIRWSRLEDRFALNGEPALQGRSVYVCRQGDCLKQALAMKAKRLHRALKRPIPNAILEALKQEMEG